MNEQPAPPNHHAHYPGFAGVAGLVAALSMAVGRAGDARLAVQLSGAGPGDRVVDIGCGPGVAVRYAAGLGAIVTGVDPAPVMRRVAGLLTRRPERISYVDGTAEAIPLPPDSAAVVWSIATVHHWADLDAGLREIRRVLVPEGCVVAMERRVGPGARGFESHGWTDDQADTFADHCRRHGFAHVCLERATNGRRSTVSVIGTAP